YCGRMMILVIMLSYTGILRPAGRKALCVFCNVESCMCWQQFEVVKGNFSRTFLHVGYHKIAEIPAGACNISIQETKKSQNYLALLSQRGVSIINGNWLINRPGIYAALGTYLTYRRPNEIRSRNGESITAPGPLTEDLHVYLIYQQPFPTVQYEYSMPLNQYLAPEPGTPSAVLPLGE
uniref:ADAMTS/ADAMTS-like Spacer 1 domain-containing protein n=1 Tax=Neolamprologus brichardi TaxID=32507 RepID=A0A3Q4MX47_NEOBR